MNFISNSLRDIKHQLKEKYNFDLFEMVTKKKIKDFNNLDNYPDLKESLVPANKTLPAGSKNTKIIIVEGEIVERVYKTPKGDILSLFPSQMVKEVA